jgi:hypothetical protein
MPHLIEGYTYELLDDKTFWPLVEKHSAAVFANTARINPQGFYSEAERTALKLLRENLESSYSLQLGIFHHDEFIGWHFGQQTGMDTYYMTNTGLLATHRRKGIYTAL